MYAIRSYYADGRLELLADGITSHQPLQRASQLAAQVFRLKKLPIVKVRAVA